MHIQCTMVRWRQVTHLKGSGRGEAGRDTPVWKRGQQETQSSLGNGQILCVGIMKIFILEVEKVLCYPSWQACPPALRKEITCAPRFLAESFGRFFIVYYILWPDLKWMWGIDPFLVQREPSQLASRWGR